MAGLDKIDPAIPCLTGGIAGTGRQARGLTAERIFNRIDKRRRAG